MFRVKHPLDVDRRSCEQRRPRRASSSTLRFDTPKTGNHNRPRGTTTSELATAPTREAKILTTISSTDRLILALDVPTATEARKIVDVLGDTVSFYKIGLELFLSGGYFELADWLRSRAKRVFADLKLFDVPQTVRSAVRQLRTRDADFVTVHGNDAILRAACDAAAGDLGILAVTVLTSLDRADMADLGFEADLGDVVLSRARRAETIGCAGVISSGHEAARIRAAVSPRFRIVVPGIRAAQEAGTDDQKRTVDVESAFAAGADYIVMGRPIRNAPDPARAAASVQARISAWFQRAEMARSVHDGNP